jgi:hypothetical protein
MLSETLSTGDSEPSLSRSAGAALSSRVNIARQTLQLRALLQEAADAEAVVTGSNEETARAELRARLEPLMAERRRTLEEALRLARLEVAAQVSAAHGEAAALLAPAPVPLVAEPVSDQRSIADEQLQAEIDAAHARAAAARARTLIKETEVRAAMSEELTVGRDALAAIEHEHALAIEAVRRAAQIEVEQILASAGIHTPPQANSTGPQGNVDDAR